MKVTVPSPGARIVEDDTVNDVYVVDVYARPVARLADPSLDVGLPGDGHEWVMESAAQLTSSLGRPYGVRLVFRKDPASARRHCGYCDSTLDSDAAHAPCGHGVPEGCQACGDPSEAGGYTSAVVPDSGPPCQEFILQVEGSLLAGSTAWREEYDGAKARWSSVREFTL